jgi:RNA polymerase sigma-70 factor (ECF subfamily)
MVSSTYSTEEQFEQLVRSTRRHALNLAYHITRDRSDAEDVVQLAYLRAWQHFDERMSNCSFEAWLMKIVRNCSIDLLRSRSRRPPTYSLDSSAQADTDEEKISCEPLVPASDPEIALFSSILDERLEAALRSLPDPWRDAMLLSAVEEWSGDEIAAEMHWNRATVRSRISRARRQLRRSLRFEADGSSGQNARPTAPPRRPHAAVGTDR